MTGVSTAEQADSLAEFIHDYTHLDATAVSNVVVVNDPQRNAVIGIVECRSSGRFVVSMRLHRDANSYLHRLVSSYEESEEFIAGNEEDQ